MKAGGVDAEATIPEDTMGETASGLVTALITWTRKPGTSEKRLRHQ